MLKVKGSGLYAITPFDNIQTKGEMIIKIGISVGPLSKRVSKYHTSKAGINGGINLYRHMTITEELSKIKDVSERQALADKMRHSVFTQSKYMRQFENPI
jgi:hypothetical protein